jgi:glutaredoxin
MARPLDSLRARAFGLITRVPGKAGELARRANDALGRPLADAGELADRREFEARTTSAPVAAAKPKAAAEAEAAEVAPVIVYHMDKTRRDAVKLTELLDAEKIPYKVSNIQEDPAAQMAVRRDSKGFRLPVVFIAGEAIGGRFELGSLAQSGELKKKVFG